MNRRKFIKTIGGTTLVLAAAGTGLSQCDQMPASAVAAWQGPKATVQDREWILSHALLAPNPHNMQAWLADLREEGVITLFVDGDRLLPDTDPFGRQVLIGQGTFLEILSIAAKERGYQPTISLFPEGSPSENNLDIYQKPVARISLTKSSSLHKDPLFNAVLSRRSNKEAYQPIYLEEKHRTAFEEFGLMDGQQTGYATTEASVTPHRQFAKNAMMTEMKTPRTLVESIDRTRIGADEIEKSPDGIDLHGPLFWWLKRFGLMTAEKAKTPGTMAYQGGIDYALGWVNGTYNMGWLITKNNDRISQVNAGRTYVRDRKSVV